MVYQYRSSLKEIHSPSVYTKATMRAAFGSVGASLLKPTTAFRIAVLSLL